MWLCVVCLHQWKGNLNHLVYLHYPLVATVLDSVKVTDLKKESDHNTDSDVIECEKPQRETTSHSGLRTGNESITEYETSS